LFIVLIGAPGAGKGTQAQWMADQFGLAHIATGDMFREAQANGTDLGLRAKSYMERGELVPDEVTVAMVMERLRQPDASNGAILDGFPRNVPQARALDKALADAGKRVDQSVYMVVPEDELLRRLSGRWLCRVCQASYHQVFNPPGRPGVCDRCGGQLYQREDDSLETAKRRLQVYFDQTMPVIGYYREKGVLDEVDGAQSIPEVTGTLSEVVRSRLAAQI